MKVIYKITELVTVNYGRNGLRKQVIEAQEALLELKKVYLKRSLKLVCSAGKWEGEKEHSMFFLMLLSL